MQGVDIAATLDDYGALARMSMAPTPDNGMLHLSSPYSVPETLKRVVAIIAGVLVCLAGLARYRRTREQINSENFEPAGFLIDLVGIMTALFGLSLAAYLIHIELHF